MQGSSKQFSVCLITDNKSYNEKKKKEQTPSQNYWPARPRPRPCGRMCVLMCAGVSIAQTDDSLPHPPARTAIHLVSLRKRFFRFNGLSFLASHSFQTLSQCPVLQSERLPSIQNSPGNGKLHTVCDTHRDIWNITWTNELCVYMCLLSLNIQCVCARVWIHSSNCKKGTIFLPTLIYNVIRNIFPCRDRVSSSLITTLWQENQEMSSPFSSHHSKLHWEHTWPDVWSGHVCVC